MVDEILLQQLTTQHTAHQQIWLSGYLYAIATQGKTAGINTNGQPAGIPIAPVAPITTAAAPTNPKVTVLYGSQTGNSKKVAQLAADQVRGRGWETTMADLNDYPVKNLKEEKIVLLAVSTQGEGEPPAAAEEFYKWLNGPRAPKLAGVQFSVCALGDKSYQYFCQTGKDFDARLEALGATRLTDRADCDVDYEAAAEAWVQAILEKVATFANASVKIPVASVNGNGVGVLLADPAPAQTSVFNRKNLFEAPILEKIPLNGRGSTKETWHLELSLEGSGLHYQPGDALGVYASNSVALVQEVLYLAMLNGSKVVTFEGKTAPLRDILKNDVELTVITRDVVDKYAKWINSAPLKEILADPAALKSFLWGRNVADLLREFQAALSEETLLTLLRKLPPRMYSIASSLEAHPDEVHLTVAAVRYDFAGRPHQGVASTFLADRVDAGDSVQVFVEENEYFKLPADDATDIIMVGPGTGVAPFRGFVEEREARGSKGRNWLFFGNPHFETDFLYQTEWLNHLKRGTLDRLDVAFSRDQQDKIYVQHRLAERSKMIFDRLENGAHFYVCGDKNRMAADVQQAVLQIISKETGKDDMFAVEYLKNLKKQRRYLEDVY